MICVMSSTILKLNINPNMLKWVKKNYGFSDNQMATKMGVEIDRYSDFESGSVKPTIRQLRSLAKQVKTPVAAFYLKKQPNGLEFPKDYRNKSEEKPLSVKARLAIRRANHVQKYLSTNKKWAIQPIIEQYKSTYKTSELSEILRKELGYTASLRISKDTLYDLLRNYIESLHILTLELPLPQKELRGFSLHGKPTIISTAVGDSIAGRIFSILHEFAHIIKHDEGMCQPYEKYDDKTSSEWFCNQFAADFLITEAEFRQHIGKNPDVSDDRLKDLADAFKTSREVILIRMIHGGLSNWNVYQKKRAEWKMEYEKQSKFFNQPNPINRALRENSKNYASEIYEQLHSERITYSEAADYLGVNINYVDLVGEKLSDSR